MCSTSRLSDGEGRLTQVSGDKGLMSEVMVSLKNVTVVWITVNII